MRKSLVAVALVASLGGCNKDDTSPTASESPATESTTATESAFAQVQATVSPVLVPASASGDPAFPYQISWTTTVKETAGVAARVDRIQAVVVDGKAIFQGTDLGGSAQLAAKGTATFNQTLVYSLPTGGYLAVISVIVDLTDARGNKVQAAAQLRII
jgi:hypothetical protein